jgi:hypothetical protein
MLHVKVTIWLGKALFSSGWKDTALHFIIVTVGFTLFC